MDQWWGEITRKGRVGEDRQDRQSRESTEPISCSQTLATQKVLEQRFFTNEMPMSTANLNKQIW
jgi:hypothetical protein